MSRQTFFRKKVRIRYGVSHVPYQNALKLHNGPCTCPDYLKKNYLNRKSRLIFYEDTFHP